MNRPIVTLPHQSGEPAASPPPAERPAERPAGPPGEPDAGIATPSATSVGAPTNHAAMLDVATALGAADAATTPTKPAAYDADSATTTANTATATGTAPAAAGVPPAADPGAGSPVVARTAATTGPTTPAPPSTDGTAPRKNGMPGPGGFRIGPAQVICWQLAVVVVAVALRARVGPVGTIATVAGALALVAVSAVRVRGTWLHQWLGIALTYVLRRRRAELPQTSDAATALLRLWLGGTVIDVGLIRERPLALVSHRAALSAMLRLDTSSPVGVREALAGLLQDDDATILASVDEQPVDLEAQLVVHGGLRHDREPQGWMAIAAYRNVGLSTDEQLAKVLTNVVRRVQRHLDRAGASTFPVDDGEAAATFVALAHADAGRGHLAERWSALSAGPVSQACLRLGGFGRLTPEDAEALVGTLLSTASGAAVTFSVGARLARGASSTRRQDPVLRVAAASPGALDLAVTDLGRVAGAYRVQPERLDGRHGPATAASLPIGRSLI